MDHPIVAIAEFKIAGPYTLHITFTDGKEETINFQPVLHGHYYGPLRDLSLFNQVHLDP